MDEHDSPARQLAKLRAHNETVRVLMGPAYTLPDLVEDEPAAPPPAPAERNGRHRSESSITSRLTAAGVIAALGGFTFLAVAWPPMRYLVFAAWMMPLAELGLLAAGHLWFRYRFQMAPEGAFTEMVIQITTDGRSHSRVTEIIKEIREYSLSMDYQIWVVTEPAAVTDYPLADEVLTVPPEFSAAAAKKGRALEYSRRRRMRYGLGRPDVKILFNDDDVTLTQTYIERAFAADYDICEGIVTPRTCYAVRPFGHFAVSHADDIRTHACLVYCSVFQGIAGRPLHVHGEGLAVTGEAEALVTWDTPLVASEDLAFGQQAVARSLRWGWFHEYAEVTSPWSLRDYFIQRSRWLWGDIHAITHRDVIPLGAAIRVSLKYVAGALGLVCSVAGLYLRVSGRIPADSIVLSWAKLSVLSWVGVFFACGWIAAGSATSARNDDSRLLAGVTAVLMMPVSVALTFAAILVPLVQGDPRTFRVIAKTREGE